MVIVQTIQSSCSKYLSATNRYFRSCGVRLMIDKELSISAYSMGEELGALEKNVGLEQCGDLVI